MTAKERLEIFRRRLNEQVDELNRTFAEQRLDEERVEAILKRVEATVASMKTWLE